MYSKDPLPPPLRSVRGALAAVGETAAVFLPHLSPGPSLHSRLRLPPGALPIGRPEQDENVQKELKSWPLVLGQPKDLSFSLFLLFKACGAPHPLKKQQVAGPQPLGWRPATSCFLSGWGAPLAPKIANFWAPWGSPKGAPS